MTTKQVADRLVELCRHGQIYQAQDELYGETITSIKPKGALVERGEGLRQVQKKGKQFTGWLKKQHGLPTMTTVSQVNFLGLV